MANLASTKSATPIRTPRDFKYAYAVNLAVEEKFSFGTFNPVPRDKLGNWTSVVGNGMVDVAMYFTDEQVTDDAGNRSKHFTDVIDMIDGRKSFKQTQSIAVKAKINDAETERIVMEMIGNRASMAEVNDALTKVENTVAAAGGRLGSLV